MLKSIKCFLDANVIANWIIFKKALEIMINEEEKNDFLLRRKKDNSDAFYSYKLLNKLRIDNIKNVNFITSSLAISEAISVINEKICMDKMYEQNIPFKYWFKYKPKFELKPNEVIELYNQIIGFKSIFIPYKKIKLVEKEKTNITVRIISLHKETHDSFLVSQAITNKANHFITTDSRLIQNLKDKINNIKIMKPETFFLKYIKR